MDFAVKQYTAIAKKPTENLLQRELKYFNTKKINYIDPQKKSMYCGLQAS